MRFKLGDWVRSTVNGNRYRVVAAEDGALFLEIIGYLNKQEFISATLPRRWVRYSEEDDDVLEPG